MVRGLTSMMEGSDRYRAVLATPFEEHEADTSRYPLYEAIAKMLEEKGLRTFVPHRDIRPGSARQTYLQVERAIIQAQLVLADIGIRKDGRGSIAVGTMLMSAVQSGVPLIAFYEEGKRAGDVFLIDTEIEYQTKSELLKKLERAVSQDEF
jgi:hypothetical protein